MISVLFITLISVHLKVLPNLIYSMSLSNLIDSFFAILNTQIDLFTFRLIWFTLTNGVILLALYTTYQNIKLLKSHHSNHSNHSINHSSTSRLIILNPLLDSKKFLCSYLITIFTYVIQSNQISINPFEKLPSPPSESSSPDISVSSSS